MPGCRTPFSKIRNFRGAGLPPWLWKRQPSTQTARVMEAIEPIAVVGAGPLGSLGEVNSTLACALVTSSRRGRREVASPMSRPGCAARPAHSRGSQQGADQSAERTAVDAQPRRSPSRPRDPILAGAGRRQRDVRLHHQLPRARTLANLERRARNVPRRPRPGLGYARGALPRGSG